MDPQTTSAKTSTATQLPLTSGLQLGVYFCQHPHGPAFYKEHIYCLLLLLCLYGEPEHKSRALGKVTIRRQQNKQNKTQQRQGNIPKQLSFKTKALQYLENELNRDMPLGQSMVLHNQDQKDQLCNALMLTLLSQRSLQLKQQIGVLKIAQVMCDFLGICYQVRSFYNFETIQFLSHEFNTAKSRVYMEINKKQQQFLYIKQTTPFQGTAPVNSQVHLHNKMATILEESPEIYVNESFLNLIRIETSCYFEVDNQQMDNQSSDNDLELGSVLLYPHQLHTQSHRSHPQTSNSTTLKLPLLGGLHSADIHVMSSPLSQSSANQSFDCSEVFEKCEPDLPQKQIDTFNLKSNIADTSQTYKRELTQGLTDLYILQNSEYDKEAPNSQIFGQFSIQSKTEPHNQIGRLKQETNSSIPKCSSILSFLDTCIECPQDEESQRTLMGMAKNENNPLIQVIQSKMTVQQFFDILGNQFQQQLQTQISSFNIVNLEFQTNLKVDSNDSCKLQNNLLIDILQAAFQKAKFLNVAKFLQKVQKKYAQQRTTNKQSKLMPLESQEYGGLLIQIIKSTLQQQRQFYISKFIQKIHPNRLNKLVTKQKYDSLNQSLVRVQQNFQENSCREKSIKNQINEKSCNQEENESARCENDENISCLRTIRQKPIRKEDTKREGSNQQFSRRKMNLKTV